MLAPGGSLHLFHEPPGAGKRDEIALRVRHVPRHALIPAATVLGWIAGSLIGGAVIVEIVFSRQGVGRLVLSAVQNKDMPLVIAVVLLAALVFVVVTIVMACSRSWREHW